MPPRESNGHAAAARAAIGILRRVLAVPWVEVRPGGAGRGRTTAPRPAYDVVPLAFTVSSSTWIATLSLTTGPASTVLDQ